MASIQEIIPYKKYKLYVELGYNSNGKRKRKTKTVEAKGIRHARKLLAEFEKEVLESQHLEESNPTLQSFSEQWKKNYAETNLQPSTLQNYYLALDSILQYFDNKRIKSIKPFHIIRFFAKEKEENKGSLESKYKVLKSLFKYAVVWRLIDGKDNPMKEIEKPKNINKQNKDFYTKDELKILFDIIEKIPLYQQLIIKLALFGGLRRGEILALADDVLDFSSNKILVKRSLQYSKAEGLKLKGTKTEGQRTIILPKKFMEELKIYLDERLYLKDEMDRLWKGFKDDTGKKVLLLFSNEYGIPFRPDSVTQFWGRLMNKNKDKIKRIRFHDLRHSSASLILSEGVNMKVVQKRLGHKNIKTTLNMYAHITDEDDKKASDIFNEFH